MTNPLSLLTLILSGLALVGCLVLAWQMYFFRRLKRTFFTGTQGADLEHILYSLVSRMDTSDDRQAVLETDLSKLTTHTGFALQKVGIVRFNPFDDGGGNFSFSIALLNQHDTGVILTSMHGRQQCRVYTKSIYAGKSELQLTQEEQQAIQQAIEKRV